jgi:bacterioferritin (cytochrome b1)
VTALPTKVVRGTTLRADPAREPCFRCVDLDSEMEGWPDMSDRARRERLHRHMNNELGALEIAAQCVADFPDAPWPLRMLLARQAADEARHASALLRRLLELGGEKGEFPVANYEWSVTMMLDDLPGRLAVQNRTFEAGLIDILGTMRAVWRESGDEVTADVLDGILADEITHVRFANRWIRRMTELDPRLLLKVALAVHMLARTNAAVAIQTGDVNAAGVALEPQGAPAVNVPDRLAAEFTEDEVKEVLKQAGFRSILPNRLRD